MCVINYFFKKLLKILFLYFLGGTIGFIFMLYWHNLISRTVRKYHIRHNFFVSCQILLPLGDGRALSRPYGSGSTPAISRHNSSDSSTGS